MQDFWKLEGPLASVREGLDSHGRRYDVSSGTLVFTPRLTQPCLLQHVLGLEFEDISSSDELLDAWGLDAGAPIRCLHMCEPVGRLIQLGLRRTIPFRGAWCVQHARSRVAIDKSCLLFPGWPRDDWWPDMSEAGLVELLVKNETWTGDDVFWITPRFMFDGA